MITVVFGTLLVIILCRLIPYVSKLAAGLMLRYIFIPKDE
jgi:hypothetical protein